MISVLASRAALVLALTFLVFGPAHADSDRPNLRTISVSGVGSVAAAPDLASITVGVTTTAETAGAALDANNARAAKVFAFLRASGVAPADMQSTNISVSPQFRPRRGNEPVAPEIIGYKVPNNVQITVRDLERFGAVLDGIVDAGANQVQGIRFDIAERGEMEKKATAAAVRDAAARAETIAEAADIRVGPVISINAGGVGPAPRPFLARAAVAEAVPVATGELTVRAQVSVICAIR